MKYRPVAITVLAIAGLAVSLYLLTVHWGWWQAVCLGVGNCELVNTSRFSEFLGIPVAMMGAGAYLALIVISLLVRNEQYGDYARMAQFFIALVGVLFSAYLTYIELYVLHEICPWCVLSAIIITAFAVLSAWELRAPTVDLAEA